jgi:hypothetical protein
MIPTGGPDQAKMLLAIVRIDGDTLKTAFSLEIDFYQREAFYEKASHVGIHIDSACRLQIHGGS